MYHVINGGQHADEDLRAGRRLRGLRAGSREVVDRTRTRLLAYCVMPNRWHLIVWPQQDGELSRFVGWLTHTRGHSGPPTRPACQAFAGTFR